MSDGIVLIISQDEEYSTDSVIDWLDYKNCRFVRLNGIDFLNGVNIEINNGNSNIQICNINWKEIRVIWFRRWLTSNNRDNLLLEIEGREKSNDVLTNINGVKPDGIKRQFNNFIKNEVDTLTDFFFSWLPREKTFGKIANIEINKLSVLLKAAEIGILIPSTFILTNKEKVEKLLVKKSIISKSISNAPRIIIGEDIYTGYTSKVIEVPSVLKHTISPSLFQEMIKKKFEIRAFYLNRKFYSMAIFSQNDSQTVVDFRRYNHKNPNRFVPYELPKHLSDKLISLAEYFNIKTGSFDIIKTTTDEYVLLEINTEGQFGMVSFPCNYYLEEKIAQELINYNNV